MSCAARAAVALVGVAGLAVAGLWVRRAVHVYRSEAIEFSMFVSTSPMPAGDDAPPGIRPVAWTVAGATQHGWYVPPTNGALVVYLHGSPGNRGSLLPEARALARAGYGALLLDLPGYGESEGRRFWDDVYLDSVRAAVDFAAAQPEVDASRIGVFGYSMGTCIAARAAARDPRLRARVLRGAFTRLDEQLRVQFRSRSPFVEELAILAAKRAGVRVQDLDTETAFRALRDRPVFLVAGAEDFAVPAAHSERLAALVTDAEVWVAPGVGHVGFAEALGDAYFDRVRAFLDRALAAPPPAR